jgi:nocardicin N-oxygenase
MSENGADELGPLPALLREAAAGGDVVPVVTPAGDKMWLVCDHALARQVLTDRRFSRAEAVKPHAPRSIDSQPVPDSIMSMDGAEHARLRRIITGTFTSGRVAAMSPLVEQLVDSQLDDVAAAGPGADLIATLAAPLPLAVLCSLLGVPAEDSSRFHAWVEVLFDISASTPREKARRRLELARYMAKLLEHKRSSRGDDLLSALIGRHDRGELSMTELVTMGLSLLMAGYETTVGQIGLAVLFLLSNPDARDAMSTQPGPTVEELLRLVPSTPVSFPRVAVEPVTLGSVTIQAGEGVIISLFDANRDARVFPQPSQFSLEEHSAPHVTFGHGPHRCPGAPLAALQTRIAVERLLNRFPGLRLAPGPDAVTWKEGLATRGLSRLAVTW